MPDGNSKKTAGRLTPTIDDVKNKLPGNIGISSESTHWRDIVFHEFILPSRVERRQGVTPATKAHKIGLFLKTSIKGELSINRGPWKRASSSHGEMYITPGGDELAWAWSSDDKQKIVCLGFHISPYLLHSVTEDVFDKEPMATPLQLDNNCRDPLLHQLMLSIYAEFQENNHLGSTYMETASQFMAAHLLHQQNKKKLPIKEYKGGLNKSLLQHILTYIDSHYNKRIVMAELARQANMSVYHFVRLFKKSVGQPPHQYIIRLRMRRADQLLTNTDLSIAEIAVDVGYDEASNFSAAYKKYKGCSPKNYRSTLV